MRARSIVITAAAVGGVLVSTQAYSTIDHTPSTAPRSDGIVLMQNTSELGTRNSPVPLGQAQAVGADWEVTVVGVDTNATSKVLAENQFNDPPAEGRQFVIVRAAAKYVGGDTGTPWPDLEFRYYGSSGNTYSTYNDSCGVIPDPLRDVGELYPGATGTGNQCFAVPADQIAGGAVIVDAGSSYDGSTRQFFAIG
ncbi:hypothetical protein ACFVVM_26400 [Nocardia sp. NPDC058176]|uniref:hypothetical protein n=1 Tax=Nocardia sp. NPDC058176 TaxID=3346368 RepID=UPI0036DB26C5